MSDLLQKRLRPQGKRREFRPRERRLQRQRRTTWRCDESVHRLSPLFPQTKNQTDRQGFEGWLAGCSGSANRSNEGKRGTYHGGSCCEESNAQRKMRRPPNWEERNDDGADLFLERGTQNEESQRLVSGCIILQEAVRHNPTTCCAQTSRDTALGKDNTLPRPSQQPLFVLFRIGSLSIDRSTTHHVSSEDHCLKPTTAPDDHHHHDDEDDGGDDDHHPNMACRRLERSLRVLESANHGPASVLRRELDGRS